MTFKEKFAVIKRGILMIEEMDKGRTARISAGKLLHAAQSFLHIRSEERRVGKECL